MLPVRRTAVALALALVVVEGCGAASPTGLTVATTSSSVPGLSRTPGHFDDGQLAFDYPGDWSTLGGGIASTTVEYVLAVLGNGTWRENCQSGTDGSSSWMNCGADIVQVPAGGIVVKIYRWYGGPSVPCRGDTVANATLGPNAVRKTVKSDVTSWELRPAGNEFGQPNNIFVEAHTSDQNQLALAEALVRSLHFEGSALGPGMGCDMPSAGVTTTAP
jgi:hypothetical protein